MHYRFLKSHILDLNDRQNRIAIPEGTECCLISDSIPEFYVLKITSPKSLTRFTVRLPIGQFDTLEEIKETYPVIIYDSGDPDKVESIEENRVIAFRKKPLPEFTLNEWYVIEDYKYPLIRFDGYDNGLYKASVPSKSNSGILRVSIDENIMRKYMVRPATSDELYKLCPNKQFSLIKTINTSK